MNDKPINDEANALRILVAEIQKAEDDETRELLLAEIQKSAAKLQELCDALEAEAQTDAEEDEETPVVEVVLTPEQRQRVLEKTGVDVPSVRIPDPSGKLTQNMHNVEPGFIEERAIEQAEAFLQLVADAEEQAEIPEEDEGEETEDAE